MKQAWARKASGGNVQERVNKIAGEMGVSSQACKWRLRNLDLLSKAEVETIDDERLVANGALACWTTKIPSFSSHFVGVVAGALDTGRLSVRRAASLLGVSVTRLARMLRAYGHETYFEA